jgi:hypothetical protein
MSRLFFAARSVVDFVAVAPPNFTSFQTEFNKLTATSAAAIIWNHRISPDFSRH